MVDRERSWLTRALNTVGAIPDLWVIGGLVGVSALFCLVMLLDRSSTTPVSPDAGSAAPIDDVGIAAPSPESNVVSAAELDEDARLAQVLKYRENARSLTTMGNDDRLTELLEAREPAVIGRVGAESFLEIQQREQLGAAAEATIPYDWRAKLAHWQVEYRPDSPSYKGLTDVPGTTVAVYVEDTMTVEDIAAVLAHELGHAIDYVYLDDEQRDQWLRARSMPDRWWAGNGLADYSVGAGDFAEAVAALWVGAPSLSDYGEFTPEQLELAESFLP